MNILENAALESRNTLGLKASCRYLIEVSTLDELQSALTFAHEKELPVIPLGGGSNVVLSSNLNGVVIRIGLMGKSVLDSDGEKIRVESGAGEDWHGFVRWSITRKAYGLENLSLIPGSVGAAPIQNIGAYGVELKDHFYSLNAVDIASGESIRLFRDDCHFAYRDSVFKGRYKDRYIITSVQFELDKELTDRLGYGGLRQRVEAKAGNNRPSAALISDVVCDIRREKLPDPGVLGNAGSFFKNPVVDSSVFARLKKQFPEIVAYPAGGDSWKLAAGWLIEKAGLKGIREGAVGTHRHQALVLVNHGGASGDDVMRFSDRVQKQIHDCFGVKLEREPRVY